MTRDFPLPRRPWCSNCEVNNYTIKKCLVLIKKWEAITRQRITNMVNLEPKIKGE